MPLTVYVRNFPEELHHALKVKAAIDKVTLQALVIRYCEEGLARDKQQTKKKGG